MGHFHVVSRLHNSDPYLEILLYWIWTTASGENRFTKHDKKRENATIESLQTFYFM